MEEKMMEETKCEQMFMEEVSWSLFAIHAMLSSINAVGIGLLARYDDDIRERASAVASTETGNSARFFEKALKIKEMREGGSDAQR